MCWVFVSASSCPLTKWCQTWLQAHHPVLEIPCSEWTHKKTQLCTYCIYTVQQPLGGNCCLTLNVRWVNKFRTMAIIYVLPNWACKRSQSTGKLFSYWIHDCLVAHSERVLLCHYRLLLLTQAVSIHYALPLTVGLQQSLLPSFPHTSIVKLFAYVERWTGHDQPLSSNKCK